MAVGSAVDVVMPQMGVSVSEGTISRWAKAVGDSIEADETIVEISTDKVDTEIPAPVAGIVSEILVEEGQTVDVGTRIAVIDTGGGGEDAPSGGSAPAAEGEATPGPAVSVEPAEGSALADAGGEPDAPAEPPPHFGPGTSTGGYAPPAGSSNGEQARDGDSDARTFMSPVVARMVAEHGLDIGRIPGTGRGGRVTKRDVETFLAGGGQSAPPAAPPPAPAETAAPQATPSAAPAAQPAAKPQPAPVAPATAGSGEEIYRFNTIRKAIAKHMRASLETAAQVTSVVEVDMTPIVGYRKRLKPEFEQRHGVGLSFMPFIMKAVIDAIGYWPWVNAEVRGDEAIIKHYVNLGIAVAVDDSKGLLVPVMKNAESLSMVGLSRALTDLADRARKKALTPDEMAGATFTLTNPGVFGALMGTPIIPTGTVAIVDIEAIVKRPVVITDAYGNDSIAIRSMMYLPISYDHRLVDGAYAAQFMALVKKNLETWPIDAYSA